jgi:hypothetical protein
MPERAAPGRIPEDVLGPGPVALAAYGRVAAIVREFGPGDVVASRTQVAFRRRRGFAYLWVPGRWLRRPSADVVLSLALDRPIDSPRFKQVVHPAPTVWMHHLELRGPDDIDAEVAAWLRAAWEAAV